MTIRRSVRSLTKSIHTISAFVVLAGLSGCARTPEGVGGRANNQLLVQFTVAGQINPNMHYFFALNTEPNTVQGPVPVVAPPWGNGWGAGDITHYVRIDAAQPGFHGFYRIEPNTNLLGSTFLGQPLAYSNVQGGVRQAQFTLDLDRILTNSGAPPTEIDINIIATDILPLNPQDPVRKLVDAFGTTGNNFATIQVQTNRIFRNAESSEPERQGDVADPDIDITDWQIEVRRS